MRATLLLLFSLLLFGQQGFAKSKAGSRAPKPLTRQDKNLLNRLARRCDDGSGQACYDYAMALKQMAHSKDQRTITRYIHRACTLAYAPACSKKSKPEPARVVSSAAPAKPANTCGGADPMSAATLSPIKLANGSQGRQITRLVNGSVLAKAGLKVGDVLTKVNGMVLTQDQQIGSALSNGGAMIEVARGNATVPLAISCPN